MFKLFRNIEKLITSIGEVLDFVKTILHEVQDIKDAVIEQKGIIHQQGKALERLEKLSEK